MSTLSHPALVINGETISFPHLDPLRIEVPALGRTLTVDVRFANHCYTCAFDADQHDAGWEVMDGGRRRAFDRERYEASRHLPAIVETLPGASVWQTRQERNFVYALLGRGSGDKAYPLFFTINRGRSADLALFVESAYPKPWPDLKLQIQSAAKVKFSLLCAKVVNRQPLRFHRAR